MRCLIIAEMYIHTYLHLFKTRSLSQSLHLSHVSEHLWEIILLKHKEMMVVLWNSL